MLKTGTIRYQRIDAKIIQSTCDVLKEVGNSARVTDLMIYQRANIGRRNFYRHYQSIDQILEESSDLIDKELSEIADRCKELPDCLHVFLDQLFVCVIRNRQNFDIEYYRGYVLFRTKTMPKLRKILTEHWSTYRPELNDEIYDYYCAAFAAIFFRWIGRGAEAGEAAHYRSLLEHLTALAVKLYFRIVKSD